MIRNSLIALSAAAVMGFAAVPAADAKTNISIGVGFGGGGIIIGTAHRCHTVMVKHNKWNKWHTKKVTFFVKERICH